MVLYYHIKKYFPGNPIPKRQSPPGERKARIRLTMADRLVTEGRILFQASVFLSMSGRVYYVSDTPVYYVRA